MASPSAPDYPVPQAAFGGAPFFPIEGDFPSVASMPRASHGATTRNTRSRARAANQSSTSAATAAARPATARSMQRKHRAAASSEASTPSSPPRKRARTEPLKKAPPVAEAEEEEDEQKPAATESCCICMCDVKDDDLAGISGCDHKFCFECIETWAERENSCPLCKTRFTKIDRLSKKRKKGQKKTKKVKQRDQRSDLVPGAALESLLATLTQRGGAPNFARLIFSGTTIGFATSGGMARRHAFFDEPHPFNGLAGFSDDEDDDDESPLSSFIRAFHSANHIPNRRPIFISSRSYASNSNDRNAGNRAENPLEIEDDSDDDVEVVEVSMNRGI